VAFDIGRWFPTQEQFTDSWQVNFGLDGKCIGHLRVWRWNSAGRQRTGCKEVVWHVQVIPPGGFYTACESHVLKASALGDGVEGAGEAQREALEWFGRHSMKRIRDMMVRDVEVVDWKLADSVDDSGVFETWKARVLLDHKLLGELQVWRWGLSGKVRPDSLKAPFWRTQFIPYGAVFSPEGSFALQVAEVLPPEAAIQGALDWLEADKGWRCGRGSGLACYSVGPRWDDTHVEFPLTRPKDRVVRHGVELLRNDAHYGNVYVWRFGPENREDDSWRWCVEWEGRRASGNCGCTDPEEALLFAVKLAEENVEWLNRTPGL